MWVCLGLQDNKDLFNNFKRTLILLTAMLYK